MRKALFAASVVALLVVLYAAAGHWLAPRFVRDALVERAQRMGLALHIGDVRTDPFDLKITLDHIVVRSGEHELARLRRLIADVAWSSLWGDAWVVEQVTALDPFVDLTAELPAVPARNDGSDTVPSVLLRDVYVEGGVLRVPYGHRTVRIEDVGLRASGLSTLHEDPGRYQLAAQLAEGGQLSSEGRIALQPLFAEGRLGVAALPLGSLVEAARGQAHASARYVYDGQTAVLSDVSIEAARVSHAGIEVPSVTLRSPRIVLPAEEPFEVSGSANLAPHGELSASGRVSLQPFYAEVQVEAADIPLPQAGRFLPADLQMTITSGIASANGRLRINSRGSDFEGAASVSNARFEEAKSGQLLLAWDELATQQGAVSFAPFRVEVGEVTARAPSGRLVIEEDGRLNFARVLPEGQDGDAEGDVHVTLRRLRIEQGTLDFADRSLENDFAVTLRELEGTITGFSTEPGNPARVRLEGRVAQYGAARIRGTVNLDAPKSLANISATLRNVPLAELTPYIVKFAGYRVESGRLSANLSYRVRDGRLSGQNQFTLEELQLGEKVRQEGVADLPLELAVALLADPQGRIRLDIPVSGNLNDPQFDFGGLVAKALGNVIGKIVSAPFRALAAVFGAGGMDLDSVRFEPGTAELTPPAEETVAQVAKALGQRPQLAVTVQGGYDPEPDLRAMRLAHVRSEIAQLAGADPEAPLDFGDPEVLQAAERLYLARAGNRLQMLELRKREPRYGRALVEALAAATPAGEEAARILARARAEMVRAGLIAHGLDPSRISLQAPVTREAGKEGVATTLALDTASAAAAGATGR
jgi:hypothetical protein